jgi:membrane protease YdiL (CAAX protease family)
MASFQDPLPAEPVATAETLPPSPPPPPRDPVWSGGDVIVLVLITFFALLFCGVVIGLYIAATHPKQKPEEIAGMPLISILAQTFTSAAVFASMYWMVVRRYRSRFWEAVRWKWPDGSLAFFWACGGVAMALLVDFASSMVPVPKSLPIYKLFGTTASAYALAGYGTLIAPVIEELFFRGFLYPVLARRSGVPAAVLLTSLGFMLIHVSQLAGAWAPLLILFFVGLAFTLARVSTGSVAVPYLMHVGYNLTLFTGLFFSTDFFRHMERMGQ